MKTCVRGGLTILREPLKKRRSNGAFQPQVWPAKVKKEE